MDDDHDLHDTIQTVVKRTDLLNRLAQGPTTKRDLRDDLGVSRSTVYKAVRELEEANLAEETGEGVRLTLSGRLLAERYRSFAETAADVCHQQALLSALPPDAPVTTDVIEGAEIIRAEPHDPNKPLDYIEDLTLDADRVIGLAPAMFRRFNDLFYDRLTAGQLTAGLVIYRPVVERLREEFGSRFADSLAMDHYTVWETTESLPFGLMLTEGEREEVAVVVYDDEGAPLGTIANDSPAALDWGRDVFERFRAGATRVEVADV